MKKLQNNFTTPEQSKRLLELGVPADSADCYNIINNDVYNKDEIRVRQNDYEINYSFFNNKHYTPCWSVGRLIEIFETCTSTKFERWSHKGVVRPLLEDCIEHIEFALNPDTIMNMDFSKLEE